MPHFQRPLACISLYTSTCFVVTRISGNVLSDRIDGGGLTAGGRALTTASAVATRRGGGGATAGGKALKKGSADGVGGGSSEAAEVCFFSIP